MWEFLSNPNRKEKMHDCDGGDIYATQSVVLRRNWPGLPSLSLFSKSLKIKKVFYTSTKQRGGGSIREEKFLRNKDCLDF